MPSADDGSGPQPSCREGVLWSWPGLMEAKTHLRGEIRLLSDDHSPLGSLFLLTFLRTGLIPPADSSDPRNILNDSPGLVFPWSRIALICFRSFIPLGVSPLASVPRTDQVGRAPWPPSALRAAQREGNGLGLGAPLGTASP